MDTESERFNKSYEIGFFHLNAFVSLSALLAPMYQCRINCALLYPWNLVDRARVEDGLTV